MRAVNIRFALYANGNFGKSCVATLVEIYALFFFTEVLRIAPGIAGAVLLMSLIWDAFTDPIWGYLADRVRHRWSTITPHVAVGVPLTVAGILAFFAVPHATTHASTALAVAGLFLFRSAYTIVDVPHNSLLVFVTRTSKERTNVASMRIFFSSMGKVAVTTITAYMIQRDVDGGGDSGFLATALILSVVFVVSLSLCTFAVRHISLFKSSAGKGRPKVPVVAHTIATNPGLRIVFLLTAINSVMTPVIASAVIYYSKYAFGDESIGSYAITALTVTQGLSIVFWAWLANRTDDKSGTMAVAYVAFAVAAVCGAVLASSIPMLFVTGVLVGFAIGGMFMLNWSMLADALDEVETGADLTIFGLYTFTNKILHGVAQAYVGLVLMLFGFESDSKSVAQAIDQIRTTIFALPIVGSVLCLVGLFRYRSSKR